LLSLADALLVVIVSRFFFVFSLFGFSLFFRRLFYFLFGFRLVRILLLFSV